MWIIMIIMLANITKYGTWCPLAKYSKHFVSVGILNLACVNNVFGQYFCEKMIDTVTNHDFYVAHSIIIPFIF